MSSLHLERAASSAEAPPALAAAAREAMDAERPWVEAELVASAARWAGLPADVTDVLQRAVAVACAARRAVCDPATDRALPLGLAARAVSLLAGGCAAHDVDPGRALLAVERLTDALGDAGVAGGLLASEDADPAWVAERRDGPLLAAGMGLVADLAGAAPAETVRLVELGRRVALARVGVGDLDPLALLVPCGAGAGALRDAVGAAVAETVQ